MPGTFRSLIEEEDNKRSYCNRKYSSEVEQAIKEFLFSACRTINPASIFIQGSCADKSYSNRAPVAERVKIVPVEKWHRSTTVANPATKVSVRASAKHAVKPARNFLVLLIRVLIW